MKKVELLFSNNSWESNQSISETLEKIRQILEDNQGIYLLTLETVETI